MTPQEKTALVVQTIFYELKGQESGHLKLTIANNDSLNGKIFKTELDDILKNLQDKELILEVLPDQPNKQIKDYDFAIHVSPTFENWYSVYLLAKGRKLTDLDNSLIQNIYHLTLDITSELQIHSTPEIAVLQESTKKFELLDDFEAVSTSSEKRKRRLDSIDFMESIDIISIREVRVYGGDRTDNDEVNIRVNVVKFEEFKKEIEKIYLARLNKKQSQITPKETPSEATKLLARTNIEKPIYQITFPMSNEVLLNDLVVLAKPNLNSENGNIFSYLMDHPKRTIPKKEIEDHIGQTIGKDFHKVVENLGFKGDVKKTFFKIANDAILFRNPITKSDFAELNIPALRISAK